MVDGKVFNSVGGKKVAKVYFGEFIPAQWARMIGEIKALEPEIKREEHFIIQIGVSRRKRNLFLLTAEDGIDSRCIFRIEKGKAIEKLPKLLNFLDVDVLHCHAFRSVIAGWRANLQTKKKAIIIYEIHGAVAFESIFRHRFKISRFPRFMILYFLENLAIILSNRLLLVSKEIATYYPVALLKKRIAIPRVFNKKKNENQKHDDLTIKSLIDFTTNAQKANKLVIVYSGGASAWQLPHETIAIIERMIQSGFAKGVILSQDADSFRQIIGENNSSWFIGQVSQRDVIKCLSLCDVGVILRKDIILNRVASPTKLYEYLHAELAIVTTKAVRDARTLVNENVAITVSLDEIANPKWKVNELNHKIRMALKNKDRIGYLAKRYTWLKERKKLLSLYGIHENTKP